MNFEKYILFRRAPIVFDGLLFQEPVPQQLLARCFVCTGLSAISYQCFTHEVRDGVTTYSLRHSNLAGLEMRHYRIEKMGVRPNSPHFDLSRFEVSQYTIGVFETGNQPVDNAALLTNVMALGMPRSPAWAPVRTTGEGWVFRGVVRGAQIQVSVLSMSQGTAGNVTGDVTVQVEMMAGDGATAEEVKRSMNIMNGVYDSINSLLNK